MVTPWASAAAGTARDRASDTTGSLKFTIPPSASSLRGRFPWNLRSSPRRVNGGTRGRRSRIREQGGPARDMADPPDHPRVDVGAIMKEIRESIQRKREQGLYTEEEVDALTDLRLRTFGEEVLIDPRLVEGLRGTGQGWN